MSWAEMMGFAARGFGIPPEAFWRLSLREWRMLAGGVAEPAMTLADMKRLAERWPDEGVRS